MTQPRNAIERRLDLLHDQWNEFAVLPEARVLRWLVTPDEWRTVEVFLASESDDRAGDIPDLFVTLAEPFTDVDGYGTALLAGLLRQYEETRPELEAEGDDASWQPMVPAGVHSLRQLVAACASLRAHHADVMERLALVLVPSSVSDDEGWQRWLQAAAHELPAEVRLVVADDVGAPALTLLADVAPERVHSVAADLDMPAAWSELARAGGTATPGGQFRVHFTELAQAVGRGDLAAASRWAEGALAIAAAQGWPHLTAGVHATLASGLVGAGRTEDALAEYQRMNAAGESAAAADPALGAKLQVQAAFGSGAALLAANDHAQAAAVYEGAAPLAARSGDALALLECWRMASHCHEQVGNVPRGWECGLAALDAAAAIPPADRATTTLPHAGEGLLRLAGHSEAHAALVHERMVELTGRTDWRPDMPVPAPSAQVVS